jgi:hypothetical protein
VVRLRPAAPAPLRLDRCLRALLTDTYPSTEDQQSIHLVLDYPDAKQDLNWWLPLVKWLLAIPHIVAGAFLGVAALFAVIIAWFAIVFTGHQANARPRRTECVREIGRDPAMPCGW